MTIRELVTKIGFRVDDKSMKDANQKIKRFASGMAKGIGVAAVGAAAGLTKLVGAAVNAAGGYETLKVGFETMLGSAEAANTMMKNLSEFAKSTPLQLNNIARGAQSLMSFGIEAKNVVGTMRMLGDAALGDQEKLNSFVLAYGKVVTKGKASLEELNMMAERGLPIFDVLAKQLKVDKQTMFKMVSKGQVTANDVKKAFVSMTSEGGRFYKGMEKQSKTFSGLVSTMKDNFSAAFRELGDTLLPVLKDLVKVITSNIAPIFKNLTPLFKAVSDILKALLGGIAPALSTLMEAFKPLIGVILPIINLLSQALIPAIKLFIPILIGLTEIIKPIVAIIGAILVPLLQLLYPLFQILGQVLKTIGRVLRILVPVFKFFGVVMKSLQPIFDAVFKALKPFFDILNGLAKLIEVFLNPVMKIFAYLSGLIGKILNTLLLPLLQGVQYAFEQVAKAIQWTIKMVKKAINDLYNWFAKSWVGRRLGLKGNTPVKTGSANDTMKKNVVNNQKRQMKAMINTNINVSGVKNGRQAAEQVRSAFELELKEVFISQGF